MYEASTLRPTPVAPSSVRVALRAATADEHTRLDAMFGRFDLGNPLAYPRFLRAHARALAPIEAAIAAVLGLEGWRLRTPLIVADLVALGEVLPPSLPLLVPNGARLWGMRYVVEGSRLGGALLARSVGAGLPSAYLGARHGAGEWRRFLDELERAAAGGGEAWRDEAIAGAREAFALFAAGAAQEMAEHG
jgi:heme oxygenase